MSPLHAWYHSSGEGYMKTLHTNPRHSSDPRHATALAHSSACPVSEEYRIVTSGINKHVQKCIPQRFCSCPGVKLSWMQQQVLRSTPQLRHRQHLDLARTLQVCTGRQEDSKVGAVQFAEKNEQLFAEDNYPLMQAGIVITLLTSSLGLRQPTRHYQTKQKVEYSLSLWYDSICVFFFPFCQA